ncbi:MAG: DUF1360 domain-containing protein [Gaiellaceae bacterium]|jgi:hypothetical protein
MAAVKSPPHAAYAAIAGTYVGGLGLGGLAAKMLGRNPACQTTLDFLVLSAASFKAAHTLAHDEVTSFLRDPFVKGRAHEGGEDPLESGDYRQAIGELVTCSRCGGTWAAAFLATTQVLMPNFGRLLTWSLASAGVNDWLQAGFAALTEKANELEERTG